MRKIFIISGPAGVGKSTTSRKLAERFEHSAYIEGDLINHMIVGGYLPPWESEALVSLTWKNIADLAINFVKNDKDVVIDYVAFPEEVERFAQKVKAEVDADIRFVVLWVDRDELLRRDALRSKEDQMGQRCLELVDEFVSKEIDSRFFYDTSQLQSSEIVSEIKDNASFKY